MERLANLFRQTDFQTFLFVLSLILFGWPVVHFSNLGRFETMFYYLFVAWGIVIFLLFLVSRCLSDQPGPEESDDEKN